MIQTGKKYKMVFYGDDFTGSTDALEFLSRAGARTVLFLDPPNAEQLSRYKDLDAFGVAGMTRALSPGDMENILRPAFMKLSELNLEHVHYKVCSTFDSSPSVGSIGRAIDVGASVFPNRFIPLLVGAPPLGRYCVFGNLFAKMGIGSEGKIFRLDRHPSMSVHPVTPADESDLRVHLSKQTTKKIGLVDILTIHTTIDAIRKETDKLIEDKFQVVLFDALDETDLMSVGALLNSESEKNSPLFSVGSSGIEMALGKYWNSENQLHPIHEWPDPGPVQNLLVLSGSCSPVSTQQINRAIQQGFEEIRLDMVKLFSEEDLTTLLECTVKKAGEFIRNGKHVIVHSSADEGPMNRQAENSPERLGGFLGKLATELAGKVKRMVIAGGDTSSYAARAMGIESVEMMAPIVPGAPLCRANAPGTPVHGLELNFKGGQVGGENYFGQLAEGNLKAIKK